MNARTTKILYAAVMTTVAAPGFADTVTLAPARDNTLYESNAGTLANGAGEHFYAGRTNQTGNSRRRAVLAFDVAGGVPAGATVERVRLVLNMSRTGGTAGSVSLHPLLADWGEGSSNAGERGGDGTAAAPGDATWQHRFFNTAPWAAAGGDFAPAPSASLPLGAVGEYTWESSAMVSDVQGWLDAPAGSFGWILVGDETLAATSKRFNSRENFAVGTGPRLIVDFRPIVVSPVPALGGWRIPVLGAAFVILGAFALRQRRKRTVVA